MMLRKSCPRCRGDLFLDRSDGPALWNCLQCGRTFHPGAEQTAGELKAPVTIGTRDRAA
jgi:ribosomal protein L37AE/L43A